MTAFATATAWRWPPERPLTTWRTERSVVTESSLSVFRQSLSIDCSSSTTAVCVRSRPRNMFATTSRLSASARS
jgi:hypothetical protein